MNKWNCAMCDKDLYEEMRNGGAAFPIDPKGKNRRWVCSECIEMFHVEHERKEGNKMNYYDELKREANIADNTCNRMYAYQIYGAITFAHYAKLITEEQFYELHNIIVKAVQKGHLK